MQLISDLKRMVKSKTIRNQSIRLFIALCFVVTCLPMLKSLAINVYARCIGYRYDVTHFAVCRSPNPSDGKVHVTVRYDAGVEGVPNAQERKAMEDAVASWNALSSTSGVVIDVAQPGTRADLEFVYTSDRSRDTGTGGCAAWRPSNSRIQWGVDAQYRAATLGYYQLASLFMHEMGHFLGLDENNYDEGQIMRQGNDCQSYTPVFAVTQASAQQVKDCIMTACVSPPASATPTPTPGVTLCQEHERYNPIYDDEGQVVGWEQETSLECNAN